MKTPKGIVRALLKTTLTEHLWASFFVVKNPHSSKPSRDSGSLVRSFLNLLEWEFCWYSDATADHLGERI